MPARDPDVLGRFWSKVDIRGAHECWEWVAGRSTHGYGRFGIHPRMIGAHKMAWILANREDVEPGLVIKHSCDNPPCCNPAHLSKGTYSENAKEAVERGLTIVPIRPPNRVCKNGHVMTPENSYQYGAHRRCRACFLKRQLKYRDRYNEQRRQRRRRRRDEMKAKVNGR